jgi:hypothetical protein
MQVRFRMWLLLVLTLGLSTIAVAQAAPKPMPKPLPTNKYCQPGGGFCFRYPASWSVLGEVFDGKGVVIAPAQKQEREHWDEVTVALVVPPSQSAGDAVTIDQLIEQAASGVRESGQNFETLERQRRRVDGKPAQMVKLHYVDKADGQEWIEELVFVEGPDAEIYSVTLKCAPASTSKIEPPFMRIVDSWTLPVPQPPAEAPAEPSNGASPKASASPKH